MGAEKWLNRPPIEVVDRYGVVIQFRPKHLSMREAENLFNAANSEGQIDSDYLLTLFHDIEGEDPSSVPMDIQLKCLQGLVAFIGDAPTVDPVLRETATDKGSAE